MYRQIIAQIIHDFSVENLTPSEWFNIYMGLCPDKTIRYFYDGMWHCESAMNFTTKLWQQYDPSHLPLK